MIGSRAWPERFLRMGSLLVMILAGLLITVAQTQAKGMRPLDSSKHVTILVLDMSGSMSQNDPDGLRCSAANAYIDLSGPGDDIGVVGLDDPGGATGGSHNFPQAVDWGLAPREMATVAERQALITSIKQKSNNCAPDAATPTYDALAKAEQMLANATQGGQISGSVILLTDGVPDPDTNAQISAIKSDLVPQFKSHNWPIDTVALGQSGPQNGVDFHGFLSDVASATSGLFYDDGHGLIPGISPLNIAPFFVDIFRVRNGRTPGSTVPPTQLDGGTTARNFSVTDYVSHLDVIVVKDNANAQVTIIDPNGNHFTGSAQSAGGITISTDPLGKYAIFSIDSPTAGAWEVDVSGSGQFLLDSLVVSGLGMSITSPNPATPVALGQPMTITCQLSYQGSTVVDNQFGIQGTITYVGGDGASQSQDISLNSSGSGTYTATVTVPTSAPAGSYEVAIDASQGSNTNVVVSSQIVVRMALFPTALLIAPATGQPTSSAVSASVVGWDAILRAIYRLPVTSWISGVPLDGHAADPTASVRGQVLLLGKAYSNATVSGVATRVGSKTTVPVQIVNDGGGAFHLIFPTDASGSYAVTLTTTGAYNIVHGDLTNATRTVLVTITPATSSQELRAWIITVIYLFLLLLIALVIRALSAPPLRGALVSSSGGGGEEFARARRGPVFWLLHPAEVLSEQMGLDPGMRFAFHRGGRITVQGARGERTYLLNGAPVPAHPVPAGEAQLASADGLVSYTITGSAHADDEDAPAPAGWRQEIAQRVRGRRAEVEDDDFASEDDDDRGGPRRGLFGRRGARARDDDNDDWGGSPSASRGALPSRGASRGRATRDDDDDDWSAPRARGARAQRAADDDDRPAQRSRRSSRRAADDDDDW